LVPYDDDMMFRFNLIFCFSIANIYIAGDDHLSDHFREDFGGLGGFSGGMIKPNMGFNQHQNHPQAQPVDCMVTEW